MKLNPIQQVLFLRLELLVGQDALVVKFGKLLEQGHIFISWFCFIFRWLFRLGSIFLVAGNTIFGFYRNRPTPNLQNTGSFVQIVLNQCVGYN